MGMLKSISIIKCWRDGCDWRRKRAQEGAALETHAVTLPLLTTAVSLAKLANQAKKK